MISVPVVSRETVLHDRGHEAIMVKIGLYTDATQEWSIEDGRPVSTEDRPGSHTWDTMIGGSFKNESLSCSWLV